MTLNALKCNHLMPLQFKELKSDVLEQLTVYWKMA